MEMLRFALAGNPNSGKTTLFNALTGSTAHVGNWPGVTVDKREGICKKGSESVQIVDLPGIYSLSPYTPEEVIARNYLLDERPDCIINIVDATNLERNLYLTTQLLEVDIPIVVALNMTDVLEKRGDDIDEQELEKRIGVPVVEISALRDTNVPLLISRAIEAAKTPRGATSVLKASRLYGAIENAEIAFKLAEVDSPLFHAVKLVEGDNLEVETHPKEAQAAKDFLAKNVSRAWEFGSDTEAEIADARYKYICEHFSPTLKRSRPVKKGELTRSDKADRILTHKWASIPLFLVILFAVFHVTFSENFLYLATIIPPFGELCAELSGTTMGAIFFAEGLNSPGAILFYAMDALTASIGNGILSVMESANASAWAVGLVYDGIWGGISAVLSFVPQILVLFLCFSILEDSGYMARVAFILDRLFRRFGVSGRAFMPMIMGFGCSIPAMANTRTLADEKERTATIRVIPFFSCGAKLPILTAISGAIVTFFGIGNAEIITYAMYLAGMGIALISLILMRNTTMRGETPPFIMELPAYHAPRFQNLMIHLWDKLKHYVEKAFTIILVSCIVIWFLSNFGWNWKMAESMNDSILASLGQLIQPIFTPLGFGSQLGSWGWVFAVAAVTGLIAKENVIATFFSLACALLTAAGSGAFSGLESNPELLAELLALLGSGEGSEEGVLEAVAMISATGATVPALLSFIVFNMTTIPCFAAVATAKAELRKGTFKWTLLFWLAASYLASTAVYTIGSWWWTAFIWAAVIAAAIAGVVLYNKKASQKEKRL
ncbi:MAG: ferrous iron transport protein B [Clostridia bacterium]|nr:ferrous iron transport protein B [Clostridia bacterium]